MNVINLEEKLSTFSQHYKPRTVAQFNGHDVMVVKVKGPFTWHKDDETDDFFLVLKGPDHAGVREIAASREPWVARTAERPLPRIELSFR